MDHHRTIFHLLLVALGILTSCTADGQSALHQLRAREAPEVPVSQQLQLLQTANIELSRRRRQRDLGAADIQVTTPVLTPTCGYPGSPAHASVTFDTAHVVAGTAASYTCDNGYELLGPPRRLCQANGTWSPIGIPFCVLNVGLGKAAMQSSTAGHGSAQKAVDGLSSPYFQASTCTMTDVETSPWWYVNLLEPYLVQIVRIDFGTACCGNRQKATVAVRVGNNRPDLGNNPLCNRYHGFIEEGKPLFLPCTRPAPGAFVSIHLEAPSGSALSICETFIYTDHALSIEQCPSFRDQPVGSTATYNGKCYLFHNNLALSFREARRHCESRGGSLVDETSPALQGFLSWELYRRHRADQLLGQYWLGAQKDPRQPQNWKWINGKDVQISFWSSMPGAHNNCSRFDGSKGWLWSDTDCSLSLNFICQYRPLTCGKPERPTNSSLISRNNDDNGNVIEYQCAPGNHLVGPRSRTCLPTGFFSEFAPKCRYLDCQMPAMTLNGDYQLLNGTTSYQSVVQYYCNDGHQLYGKAQLTCDWDERWNGPPPRCDPLLCPAPVPPSNGYVTVTSNVTVPGTQATYDCRPGYELVGDRLLTCSTGGAWDFAFPYCRALERRPQLVLVPAAPARAPTPRPTQRPAAAGSVQFPTQAAPAAPAESPNGPLLSAPASSSTTTSSTASPQPAASRAPEAAASAPTWPAAPSPPGQASLNGLPAVASGAVASGSFQQPASSQPPEEAQEPAASGAARRTPLVYATSQQPPAPPTQKPVPQQPAAPAQVPVQPSLPVALDLLPVLQAAQAQPAQQSAPPPRQTAAGQRAPGAAGQVPNTQASNIQSHFTARQPSTPPRGPPQLPASSSEPQPAGSTASTVQYAPIFTQPSSSRVQTSQMASARYSLDGIIASAIFGGFLFLGTIITIIVIIIRRRKSSRSSIDAQTISTYDSAHGEHSGLYRNYQQAWENLRYSTGSSAGGPPKALGPVVGGAGGGLGQKQFAGMHAHLLLGVAHNPALMGGAGGSASAGSSSDGSLGAGLARPAGSLHALHHRHARPLSQQQVMGPEVDEDDEDEDDVGEALGRRVDDDDDDDDEEQGILSSDESPYLQQQQQQQQQQQPQQHGHHHHHHHHHQHLHHRAAHSRLSGSHPSTLSTSEGFRDSDELTINADTAPPDAGTAHSASAMGRALQRATGMGSLSNRPRARNHRAAEDMGSASQLVGQSGTPTSGSGRSSAPASPPDDQLSLDRLAYGHNWQPKGARAGSQAGDLQPSGSGSSERGAGAGRFASDHRFGSNWKG